MRIVAGACGHLNGDKVVKTFQVMSASVMFLLLAITVPANARQGRPEKQGEKAKPAPQRSRAPQQQQQNSRQQARGQQNQQQRRQQQGNSVRQQPQQQVRGPQNQRQRRQQHAASSQRPQRTQQAIATQRAQPMLHLGARGSGRIPDARFHSNFGREHQFRMGNPVLVGGYSRFQYGGYWFGFVQPWPVGWYYTDDVYIDYMDGGYYMFDPYHPGARFAISVVL
jgi:hypothetical protein